MRSKHQGSDLFSGSKISGDDLSSGSRIQQVNPSTDQSLPLFCLSTALQCARCSIKLFILGFPKFYDTNKE